MARGRRTCTAPTLVILPGGFAYGDYLRAGVIARFSPVMGAVREHAARGGLVLGICNGFQVLAEAGLLPGALLRNATLRFEHRWVRLSVERRDTPFTRGDPGRDRRCGCRSRTARAATTCRMPTSTRSRRAAAWCFRYAPPGGQSERLGARHRGRD